MGWLNLTKLKILITTKVRSFLGFFLAIKAEFSDVLDGIGKFMHGDNDTQNFY